MTQDIAFVFGTRPEIIKLAPIVKALDQRSLLVHTGQHFDVNMSQLMLTQLGLREPDVLLDVGGRTRGTQIGLSIVAIEELFLRRLPSVAVVQGDTNSGLAGALAANSCGVPLVHLEAGLRSFDRSMPEEHNRVLIDALADRCLTPHVSNNEQLMREGVDPHRIRLTGSTLREALLSILPNHDDRVHVLDEFRLSPTGFILATIHRVENVDQADRLEAILTELAKLDLPVVLPLHPRTRKRAETFGLSELLDQLVVIDPLGYREFVALAAECALLVSDSGGVQEEATILKRPVVVVRSSTERPEILGTFAHLVDVGPGIGAKARELLSDLPRTLRDLESEPYPYGENATALCVAEITQLAEQA
jgi:UDP-N-acetylglucosamine 2-epimerase (non-hydrolysing)